MNRLKVENDTLIFINQELGRINEGLQSEIGQIKSQSSQPSRQPSRSFISDDVDASDNDRPKKNQKNKKKEPSQPSRQQSRSFISDDGDNDRPKKKQKNKKKDDDDDAARVC